MSDAIPPHLRFIIAGRLQRDYYQLQDGRILEDRYSGSAISAAVGVRVWENAVGMVARVDREFPTRWLEKTEKAGIDTRGVVRIENGLELRRFLVHEQNGDVRTMNPVEAYAQAGREFPPDLLGFNPPLEGPSDSRSRPIPATIRHSDFPDDYTDATAAHICALDYLSHIMLPPLFREGHVNTVTLEAGSGYMDPVFYDDISVILHSLSAFICDEAQALRLFLGRTTDIWEAAEGLAGFGCALVMIRRGMHTVHLFEREGKRKWIVPAYPSRLESPFGVKDAYCGGFLAGLRSSYDPVHAALQGMISASFAGESVDVLYPVEAMPGLAAARLELLKDKVRRV